MCTTQSETYETDQNEKSLKVCKTASFNFSLFHVHRLSPGATFYAIAGPLAIYPKIRDVPEETKFVILYTKSDFFLKNDLKLDLVVYFFCAPGCLMHMGMGLNRHGERVRIHFVLWKKSDFCRIFPTPKITSFKQLQYFSRSPISETKRCWDQTAVV